MAIPLYLAQTGAEFRCCKDRPDKIGWMACHFSPYGTGLSNLPPRLPEGSILILNDRTPVRRHDPQRIYAQLAEVVRQQGCSALLIDFQRQGNTEAAAIAKVLIALPCPVAVSASYAGPLDCPVFLPPVPLLQTVEAYLQPWSGREIWMDAALDGACITVTASGSRCEPLSGTELPECRFYDEELNCHYRVDLSEGRADFILRRTREDLQSLLEKAETHGATHAVGLYQEFIGS